MPRLGSRATPSFDPVRYRVVPPSSSGRWRSVIVTWTGRSIRAATCAAFGPADDTTIGRLDGIIVGEASDRPGDGGGTTGPGVVASARPIAAIPTATTMNAVATLAMNLGLRRVRLDWDRWLVSWRYSM